MEVHEAGEMAASWVSFRQAHGESDILQMPSYIMMYYDYIKCLCNYVIYRLCVYANVLLLFLHLYDYVLYHFYVIM